MITWQKPVLHRLTRQYMSERVGILTIVTMDGMIIHSIQACITIHIGDITIHIGVIMAIIVHIITHMVVTTIIHIITIIGVLLFIIMVMVADTVLRQMELMEEMAFEFLEESHLQEVFREQEESRDLQMLRRLLLAERQP